MAKTVYDRCLECLQSVFTFDGFDVMTVLPDTPLFSGANTRRAGDEPIGDSLDLVEFGMALEDEFKIEIPDEAFGKFYTLKDTVTYLESRIG